MSLNVSTLQADSERETCICRRECSPDCSHNGRWHNHSDEVCAVHPDTIVDAPAPD